MLSHVRSRLVCREDGSATSYACRRRHIRAPVATAPQRVVRALLFVGFAFAVMADPVSSVAYTIEASLRALNGHLGLLMATQIIVLAIIALVDVNYWQLVGRFPLGGGSAEAAARAFGTGWVFLPIGALIVDFVLTITISVAAAVSALIAYVPAIAPARIAIGLALLVGVAALTWFGHGGRLVFAVMTLLFIASAVVMLVHGFANPVTAHGSAPVTGPEGSAVLAVVLSFPVAMALATGTEAPATAIGQLGQLGADDRRRFARATILLTMVIVAALTIAITALAVRLHVGIPSGDSTQIADVAHAAAGGGAIYALFQASSALLLLAAASSSFQAGPGLLKALSRHPSSAGVGILPRGLGETNSHHTPYWSVLVYLGDLRRDPARRRRTRTGAGAVLRRRGVRQLPGRAGRDGEVLASRGPPGLVCDQPGRCRRGRVHPDRQPRPRLPPALARGHRPDRRRALRALDTSRTTLRGGRGRGPHRR